MGLHAFFGKYSLKAAVVRANKASLLLQRPYAFEEVPVILFPFSEVYPACKCQLAYQVHPGVPDVLFFSFERRGGVQLLARTGHVIATCEHCLVTVLKPQVVNELDHEARITAQNRTCFSHQPTQRDHFQIGTRKAAGSYPLSCPQILCLDVHAKRSVSTDL